MTLTEPKRRHCFKCRKPVTARDFCHGCREHVCERCDAVALDAVIGAHTPDRHLASAKPTHDPINHPKHYTSGSIEVIDAIEAWGLGFHDGNVVKYVARAKHKGSELEDLKKARWYLDRLIERLAKRGSRP